MENKKYCCETMKENSEFTCKTCKDAFECPDTLIYHDKKNNDVGIIIHDGGSSYIQINYCPWCGKELGNKREGRSIEL